MSDNFSAILIWSIVIAVIAATIAVVAVIIRYKKKLKAPIYPIDRYASLSLFARRDDFIGSNVTRVRISSKRDRR